MYPAHGRYWDIRQDKSVHIASPAGQAQFMLTDYLHMAGTYPNEWMLLCRFADTIQAEGGEWELRQLRRLAEHLKTHAFESTHGHVDPAVAVEVEKNIILRSAPYYAGGQGHDVTPAAKLLKDYEWKGPVFTQAERNLVLRYAYFIGDAFGVERLTSEIAERNFTNQDIAAVCADIEEVDLAWSGLEQLEGIEVDAAERPTFQFSFENCGNPVKIYPRFAFYPGAIPEEAVLLQSGVILQSSPDGEDRWQSGLLKIDQTYTAPRYYIQTDRSRYEMEERVDGANLEKLLNGQDRLSPLCGPALAKPSVLGRLREAAREIGQHPTTETKAKGGEAR